MDKAAERFGAVFVPDTNVVIRACDDSSFAERVRRRMGSCNSEMLIPSQVISELERCGLDANMAPAFLKSRLSIRRITFDSVSPKERKAASWLESRHKTLHAGDSSILAFAHARGLTLLTCDNGLVRAARDVGVRCVNPDARGRGLV